MTADSLDVKQLLASDPEFQQLFTAHHEIEQRLHELSEKHYLTGPEEIEEATLKKRKLHIKDRMTEILRQRPHAGGAPGLTGQLAAHPQPQG
ncbi:MAG TPA: YdcH family protein [Vicinamibacterales bacterium]|nr:YdcH family protein [Vicinamibacterales bacterium]